MAATAAVEAAAAESVGGADTAAAAAAFKRSCGWREPFIVVVQSLEKRERKKYVEEEEV